MQDKIYRLVVEQNDLGWKSVILELVRSEQLDPWDVDVGLLTKKYLEKLDEFKSLGLNLSGKVVLAAALLLKIKSNKLTGEDFNEFDSIISASQSDEDSYDDLEMELERGEKKGVDEKFDLIPHTPQPRTRKVSVYDLVKALEKALEVKKRRVLGNMPGPVVKMPENKFDIGSAIKSVFSRISDFFALGVKKVTFKKLVNSEKREDKVYTFIPLLHLANEGKIDLEQDSAFGEIEVLIKEEKKNGSDN